MARKKQKCQISLPHAAFDTLVSTRSGRQDDLTGFHCGAWRGEGSLDGGVSQCLDLQLGLYWAGMVGGLLGPKELISRLAPEYEYLVWFPDMLSSEEVMR